MSDLLAQVGTDLQEGEIKQLDQIALISALLHNRELLVAYRPHIDPAIWQARPQIYLVETILKLWDQNGVLPRKSTILRVLQQDVTNPDMLESIKRILFFAFQEDVEESKGTFTIELVDQIKRLAYLYAAKDFQKYSLEGKFDKAKGVLRGLDAIGTGEPGYKASDPDRIDERCDPARALYDRKKVISSGFTGYTSWHKGGHGVGELHVIAARSGRGKTRHANNIAAEDMRQGRRCCVAIFEGSETLWATRIDQILLGCSVEDTKTEWARTQLHEIWKQIRDAGGHLDIKRMSEYDTTPSMIEAYMLSSGEEWDRLTIDYLDLMIPDPLDGLAEWRKSETLFAQAVKVSNAVNAPCLSLLQVKNVEQGVLLGQELMRGNYGKIDPMSSLSTINELDDDDINNCQYLLHDAKNRFGISTKFQRYQYHTENLRVWEVAT